MRQVSNQETQFVSGGTYTPPPEWANPLEPGEAGGTGSPPNDYTPKPQPNVGIPYTHIS